MKERNIARGAGMLTTAALLTAGLSGRGLPVFQTVFAAGGLLLCVMSHAWLRLGGESVCACVLESEDVKKDSKPDIQASSQWQGQ